MLVFARGNLLVLVPVCVLCMCVLRVCVFVCVCSELAAASIDVNVHGVCVFLHQPAHVVSLTYLPGNPSHSLQETRSALMLQKI